MKKRAIFAILALLYPLLVFIALKTGFSLRVLLLLLVLLALLQFNNQKVLALRNAVFACYLLLIGGLLIYGDGIFLKLYPVLVSASMLAVFAFSLKNPPSVAERFALIKHKSLPPQAIEYCRKVTVIWCFFFVFNASVALATVFLSDELWVLYNGLVSYLLIGGLAGAEFIYRQAFMRRMEDGS